MKNRFLVFLFLLISIKVHAQCTLDGNIRASSTTICSGIVVDLIAGPTGGTKPYRYSWNTGEATDTIHVNKAGTYSVTVTDQAGCQTIRTIEITSNAVPDPPTAANGITCPNTSATLKATAPGGVYQWYDAPVGGNFLGSGDTFNTPPITSATIFYVQTSISGCISARTAVTVYPIAGPTVSGNPTCPGSSVTFTADGAGDYQWYDSPTGGTVLGTGKTFTTPALFSTTNYYVVGTTAGCTSLPTTATAVILPVPPAPETSANVTVCSGSVLNLHVTKILPNTIYDWFDTPSGGTSIISSPDYTTPILNSTVTYYVQSTVNGCVGPRTAVTVTVNPIPAVPTIPAVTGCSGNAVTITAPATSGTYNWYATPSSTTILATGNTYTTPVLNVPTTFYVELVSGGCVSPRAPVTVNITPTLTAPTVSAPTSVCIGDAATLTAIGPGGTYDWFSVPVGGTSLFTGAIFKTPPLTANAIYYVQTTSAEGCVSQRAAITVLATATPTPPTFSGVTNICPGSSTTLTAAGDATTFQWYDAPTGGNLLAANAKLTISPSITTTYYVQAIANTCTSTRTAVTVTVEPIPAAPTAETAPAPICPGATAVISASSTDGTVQWFDAAVGGKLLSTGDAFTTPALTVNTTYYAGTTNGACVSSRTPVTVTIINTSNQFSYSSGTYCTSASNTVPNITVPGGTFSATPAGLVINSSTGEIDIAASTIGKYVVKYAGTCSAQTQNISIVTTPKATFSFSAPRYCQTLPDVSPTFAAGASAGIFSASPAGLVFVSTSTGEIDLSASKPGTYSIINTINGSGGCPSVTSSPVSVIIDGTVTVSAGNSQSLPVGTAVQLSGTITGAVTKGTWSGGKGTFSDKNDLNAIYTPAPGETFATLRLTSNDPGNSCGISTDTVNIGFGNRPKSPTVSVGPVCPGNPATIVAYAPGGDYEWYSAAVGGTLLYSGATFVTPALTSSTTYFVQTTLKGITSDRTTVSVTVLAAPGIASVGPAPAPLCPGGQATLNATTTSGTLQWLDATGKLLGTGTNFTTPSLTTTTTFYVGVNNGTCTGTLTPITVPVVSLKDQVTFASGTYCKTSADPVPTIKVTGGTFSAVPAGLVINSTTGKIDIAASTVGNYTINYTNVCGITSTKLTLVVSPNANFTYSAARYCQNTANVSPAFNAGASAGVFSATPAGLVFTNSNTGQIDLTASQPGTYSVVNTISGTGGCATVVSTPVSVTIDPAVIISAGADQVVATGTPATLTGSITGGVTTGTWSGGTGTFASKTSLTTTYTAGPGETSVILTLTSADPGTSCGPQSKTVKITFSPKPASPTVLPGQGSTCSGGVTTLTATAPGGTYTWFAGPTGGTPIGSGVTFVTPPLTATTLYYVETTIGGLASDRTAVTVTVNPSPTAPTAAGMPICSGSQATLVASGSTGSYEWYDAKTGGNRLFTGASFTTPFLTASSSYYVQTTVAGCISERTKVDVTVNPLPTVTSAKTETICSGNALNYTMAANLAGTTFKWSRAASTEISNPAVIDQTSNTITETLISTVGTVVKVVYKITPILNGCEGIPFDYAVTVLPVAQVISAPTLTVCSGNSLGYTLEMNTLNDVQLSWSRAEVPGILNKTITGQQSRTIYEYLQNTTTAPIDVNYVFTYGTGTCTGSTFTLKVTVNPKVNINSAPTGTACSGIAQAYQITSDVPTAKYVWSRDKIPGISNPIEPGKVSQVIDEALINRSGAPITVDYHINTATNGCQTADFIYSVIVYPEIPKPDARGNSPVCAGNTIQLDTDPFPAGTFKWEGPNGFSSTLRNPAIPATAAAAGVYKLYLLANGCNSEAGEVEIKVDEIPVTNAGADRTICKADPYIQLDGSVSTKTGFWTGGNGRYEPSSGALNAKYYPTNDERLQQSITFTLHSTSLAVCAPVVDDVTYTFGLLPAADAGKDQQVCIVAGAVSLDGTILIPGKKGVWGIIEGTGVFNPTTGVQENGQPSPQYIPSAEDIKRGKVTLVLTTIGAPEECYIPSDKVTLSFLPPPIISAGPTKYLLKGNKTTLTPSVSEANVSYHWSPSIGLDNDAIKNPTVTGDVTRDYTLTVTDSRGCTSDPSTVRVIIQPQIEISNTFTPNGDGVNDVWDVQGLIAYPDAVVDIFNRNGQKVYHSIGYTKPWDGTYNGMPLPFGTYYYIIDPKMYGWRFTGYVTLVK